MISNFIWKPYGIRMLRLHFHICAAFEETAFQALAGVTIKQNPGTVPGTEYDALSKLLDQDLVDLLRLDQQVRINEASAKPERPVEQALDVQQEAVLHHHLVLQLHHQLLKHLLVVGHEEDLESVLR